MKIMRPHHRRRADDQGTMRLTEKEMAVDKTQKLF